MAHCYVLVIQKIIFGAMLKLGTKKHHHPTWAEDVAPARWKDKAKPAEKANVARTKDMHDNITRATPSGGLLPGSLATPDT